MSKTARFLVFCLLVLSFVAAHAANEELRAIAWPTSLLAPKPGLRVSEIRIMLACGEFRAIRYIPSDWNVELERPVSGRTKLHLSAGHGASELPNLKALSGAIVVSGTGSPCFDASAIVYTESSERRFTRTELGLGKASH